MIALFDTQNVSVGKIQLLLGHRSLQTTVIYMHLEACVQKVTSPLYKL
jgi:site-specific recombinase XerD